MSLDIDLIVFGFAAALLALPVLAAKALFHLRTSHALDETPALPLSQGHDPRQPESDEQRDHQQRHHQPRRRLLNRAWLGRLRRRRAPA